MQLVVTLIGINQLLLQFSDLHVTHVNLLLKQRYVSLRSTITFICLHTNSHIHKMGRNK